jgi:hypothetical protein
LQRWDNIIDFLKVHYALSERTDSDYWCDHREMSQLPEDLQEQLQLWKTQSPYHYDTTEAQEMFPPASFQYILYGMGFITDSPHKKRRDLTKKAEALFNENIQLTRQLVDALPKNRELINKIKQYGLPKI